MTIINVEEAIRELSERILISRTNEWLQISKYGLKNKNI